MLHKWQRLLFLLILNETWSCQRKEQNPSGQAIPTVTSLGDNGVSAVMTPAGRGTALSVVVAEACEQPLLCGLLLQQAGALKRSRVAPGFLSQAFWMTDYFTDA